MPGAPPFTRLHVTDPDTNRVVQDIYDKLQALVQTQNIPSASSPAPAAPPGGAIRHSNTSSALRPTDKILSFSVGADSSCLLPPTRSVQGLGPYTIQNSTASTANLTLDSALGELVNGAAASATILAPGDSRTLQPNPGSWLVTASV